MADPTHDDVVVTDAPDRLRSVATVDGVPAGFTSHDRRGPHLFVRHTEVDAAFEGRGVGGALARHVVAAARDAGLRLVPICPFVARWLERHPEHADLVDHQMLAAYRR